MQKLDTVDWTPRQRAEFETRCFDAWMEKVNAAVFDACGLTSEDLDDFCYSDMFEDGYSPREAAREAIRNSGG